MILVSKHVLKVKNERYIKNGHSTPFKNNDFLADLWQVTTPFCLSTLHHHV